MILKFSEIMKRRKLGAHLRWAPLSIDNTTAANRIKQQGYVDVYSEPKFSLSSDAKVFAIGSCFARNIEEKLERSDIDVISRKFRLDPDEYAVPARPNAALNKYNTHSIEDELKLAFGDQNAFKGTLIEAGKGQYFDPMASYTKIADLEKVKQIREKITSVTKLAAKCDAIIITLGQNEVWKDLETGCHLNTPPPTRVLKKHRERFAVDLIGYEDNLKSLINTVGILQNIGCQDKKIILTVSPVPMGTTLSKMDVISANMYSKSMLRVCAQYLYDQYDFIDYFPSYEMAMYSPRNITWRDDTLHVTNEAVEFITNIFVARYVLG